MSMKTVRNTREPLKKPRPLKSLNSSDSVKYHIQEPKETVVLKSKEDILTDLETLNINISNCNFDDVTLTDISRMCAILKRRGEELDTFNKEAIDRYFCTLRNASREERLDMVSRLKLLETIEIRANGWKKNDNIQNYYNSKILELEQGVLDLNISTSSSMTSVPYSLQNQNIPAVNPVPLAHGEIFRSSGKFAKPTKIAGKNIFKDEILIRNSDSGKVNPGARDRLVQITGPHEEAIGHAKLLVEDTIRRNVSPIREKSDISVLDNTKESMEYNNLYSTLDNQMFMKKSLQHSYSLSDASLKEHAVSLKIDHDLIHLKGTNPELLKTAKLVLIEYFAGQTEINEKQHEHFSLNHQSSPDRNKPRHDLKRQSSLKGNIETMYSASWLNSNSKRESVSPFSSSDDDYIREDKKNDIEQINVEPNYLLDVSNSNADIKRRAISFDTPSVHAELIRRSSVPNNFGNGFPDIGSPAREEIFSPVMSSLSSEIPPIPPPTYKSRRYSRDSLLNLANSPFSHNQPADYAHIYQTCQEIICQSPIMFDPQKFKDRENKPDDAVSGIK